MKFYTFDDSRKLRYSSCGFITCIIANNLDEALKLLIEKSGWDFGDATLEEVKENLDIEEGNLSAGIKVNVDLD